MSAYHQALAVLHSAISIMTPFLLAAIGGLFTELAGMLNIALEGLMLTGAFLSVVFVAWTGNLTLGILLGVLGSMLLSLIFASATLNLRANLFISGLATNLFASGLTIVLANHLYGTRGVVRIANLPSLPAIAVPVLRSIPVLGDLLSGHNVLVYGSWALAAVCAVVMYRTPFGLRLRATGLGAKTVASLGLRPARYQLAAFLISGLTCGLGGAFLTLSLGAFVPDITAGRGWIALVAIYLGNKTPLGTLAASLLFGFAESISNFAQGWTTIPADFILAIPYLITVLAMIGYSIWQYHRAHSPAGKK